MIESDCTEVAYVLITNRYDWAVHAEDFIARRTRLPFLNKAAATEAVPIVVKLMAKELKWDRRRQKEEENRCYEFLKSFGGPQPVEDAAASK